MKLEPDGRLVFVAAYRGRSRDSAQTEHLFQQPEVLFTFSLLQPAFFDVHLHLCDELIHFIQYFFIKIVIHDHLLLSIRREPRFWSAFLIDFPKLAGKIQKTGRCISMRYIVHDGENPCVDNIHYGWNRIVDGFLSCIRRRYLHLQNVTRMIFSGYK